MKIRRALIGFGAITIFYLIALIWIDTQNQFFSEFSHFLELLPILVGLSLLSYFVRYLRWCWLLSRAGNKTNLIFGYFAYLSGFAFTATPGKVGELIRIRYLAPKGVRPWLVLAAFIYERAFDLMTVLMLSALAISRIDVFVFVFGFVVLSLAGLVCAALNPGWLTRTSVYLRFYRLKKLARICITLRDGLSGCRIWAKPLDILVSMILGLLAWSLTSFSFVLLLSYLGVSIPILSSLAIYPLSMLAGAASMLPGGVGSTEITIVALLSFFNVPLETATLAAIGIRFSSMWFAVFCGFIALSILELCCGRGYMVRFSKYLSG